MNRFVGVGMLAKDGVLNGADRQVLKFTLVTYMGQSKKTGNPRLSYVPCVVFGPSAETVKLLTAGTKGIMISLEGRVNTSQFQMRGETRYSTEVVVDEWSIRLIDVRCSPLPESIEAPARAA